MHLALDLYTKKWFTKLRWFYFICSRCSIKTLVRHILAVFVVAFLAFGTSYFVSSTYAAAGINQTINFQGKLVTNSGLNVADGNYDITFYLYAASSGGSALWTEVWNTGTAQVPVQDGVFRVALGTHSVLTSFNFNDDSLYLAVKVGADPEMTPRIRFTSVPYAFVAKTVVDDALDFDQFKDTMALDANTTVNQSSYTWTQNFTGNTTTGYTYNANSLTTGKGLFVSSSATGLTGNLAEFTLSGSNAGNTGNVVRIAQTGTSSAGVPLMVTNLGTGLSFRVNDETGDADTTPFVIDAGGNVGIGTTAPGYLLQLGSGSYASNIELNIMTDAGVAGRTRKIFLGRSGRAGGELRFDEDTRATQGFIFNTTNAAYPMSFKINDTSAMFISTAGNVGIGTTSPTTRLNVRANATGEGISLTSSATSAGKINLNWYDGAYTIPMLEIVGRSDSGYTERALLRFKRGDTIADYLVMGATFETHPFLAAKNNFAIGIDKDNTGTGAFAVIKGGMLYNRIGTDGTTLFYIGNSGNVGIGTTAPTERFEVYGGRVVLNNSDTTSALLDANTATLDIVNRAGTAGAGPKINFHGWGYGTYSNQIGAAIAAPLISASVNGAAQDLVFLTRHITSDAELSERMRILNTGNVGIGTTGPTQKLDVNGNVILSATSPYLYFENTSNYLLSSSNNLISKIAGSYYFRDTNSYDRLSILSTGDTTINNASNVNVATFKNSGNVGIGTTSPTAKLTIQASSSAASLGSELLITTEDRDFSSSSGNWSGTNWTIGSGVATHTAGANSFIHTLTPTAARTYQILATINTTTAGTIYAQFGAASGSSVGKTVGTLTQHSWVITATDTTSLRFIPDGAWAGTIDDVSVKEITQSSAIASLLDSNAYPFLEFRGITSSGDSENIALGRNSIMSNITGIRNTSLGSRTLEYNTTGNSNVAIGYRTLRLNTTGSGNSAVGQYSLLYNTTGSNNSALGIAALSYNTTGSGNTASGLNALLQNTSGDFNVALGYTAMQLNTTGSNNAAVGLRALEKNTTGSMNVALGYWAGRFQADGATSLSNPENSVYIGAGSRGYDDNDDNSIVIGYNAIGLGANTVVLGNDSITTTALKGNVGVGTTAPAAKLQVAGTLLVQPTGNSTSSLTLAPGGTSNRSFLSIFATSDTTTNYTKLYTDQALGAHAFITTAGGTGTQYPISFNSTLTNPLLYINPNGNIGIGGTDAGATPKLFVDGSSGNVGIGTTNPTSLLHINGSGAMMKIVATANDPVLFFNNLSQNWYSGIDTSDSNKFKIATSTLGSGYDMFVINASGNVGIGTTAPTAKLDIDGQIRIRGGSPAADRVLRSDADGLATWVDPSTLPAGSVRLNNILAATGTNTIDSLTNEQVWNWSTASTHNPFTLTANALTTGSLLSLTSSNASLNSNNGLLYVANTNTSTNGIVARIQSNSTAGSGLTVRADGNVGIGTTSPSALIHGIKTTEQLRLGYDASNYYTTTVGSTGGVTYDAVGIVPGFTFSDAVAVNGILTLGSTNNFSKASGIGTLSFITTTATDGIVFTNSGATSSGNIGMNLTTGATTGTGIGITANSLTTGKGLEVSSNALISGSLVNLQSISNNSGQNGQKILQLQSSGANSFSSATTYGLYLTNTRTGTTSTNVGAYIATSGATTNLAIDIAGGDLRLAATSNMTKLEGTGNLDFQTTTATNGILLVNKGATTSGNTGISFTTSATTGNGMGLAANSLTTGSGFYASSTSVTSGSLMNLVIAGSGAASNTQKVLNISNSGNNSTAQTTYGSYITNTRTGEGGDTNVAGYFSASGVSNNYGLIVANGSVGIGTTAPGALLQIGTAGTSLGTMRLTGNTSGYVQLQTAAAAGSWTMTLPSGAGSNGQQLTTNGAGVTSWTAAGSLRSMKNVLGTLDPSVALDTLTNAKVYRFNYKPGMGTGDSTTEYVGIMADEAPWAMHYSGTIVNPVNTLGYAILGIQALDTKINMVSTKTNNIEKINITPEGKLGVGTTAPTYKLDVVSSGPDIARFMGTNSTGCTLSDGGVISCSSDRSLKKDVVDVSSGLDALMQLRPVSFHWNSQEEGEGKYLGFIAQEVEEVLPELVSIDSTGYKQLNSIGLIPVVAKAVQEQQGLILSLQQEVQGSVPDTKIATLDEGIHTLTEKVGFWDGVIISFQSIIQSIQDTIASIQNQMLFTQDDIMLTRHQVNALAETVTDITAWKEAITSGAVVLGASHSALLTTPEATMSALTVTDSLQVDGPTTVFDLTVLNKLTTGVIELGAGIDGDEINSATGIRFQTLAQAPIDFMNGKVVIDVDGSIKASQLKIDTTSELSSAAGKALMGAGELLVTVPTTRVSAESLVLVTVEGDYAPATRYWVTNVTPGESFTVRFDRPSLGQVTIHWMLVN